MEGQRRTDLDDVDDDADEGRGVIGVGMLLSAALWIVVAASLFSCSQANAQELAAQYRGELTRSAYRVFGPSAPVATLAAQIHQESAWRADARSRVGALGIAQFMPLTAQDMADRHPADCAPANPLSPSWAFRCRDRYMRSLVAAQRPMSSGNEFPECARWEYALRAYHGGLGWINRDRRLAQSMGLNADRPADVASVNAGRSVANHAENTNYPTLIFGKQDRYMSWGRAVCV